MPLLPILRALRFGDRDTGGLEAIRPGEWPRILGAADREGITLALGTRCRDLLPPAIRARIDRNLEDNTRRYSHFVEAYAAISAAMRRDAVDFAVLKGISQWPYYGDDLRFRPQYDIDLYCPPRSIEAAAVTIRSLGYEPVGHAREDPSTDHLPVMIRKTGWTWREDYYDPDMPPAIEIHHRFWDADTERFSAGAVGQFWNRRGNRELAGLELPALNPVDGLTYSTLHLVRHVLRGNLRIHHAYELAHFLERSSGDDAFWNEWRESGLAGSREVEGIAFRLAAEWFRCGMHPAAREAIEGLRAPVKRWFELFALSPALAADHPNKNELWLHLSLVAGARNSREVAMRRLFPIRRARVLLDAHVTSGKASPLLRARRVLFETAFVAKRFIHHVRTLPPMALSGFRWWRASL